MLPLFLGVGLGLTALAWLRAKAPARPQIMTPNVAAKFSSILQSSLSPQEFQEAAKIFESNGLFSEASILKKRASLVAMPEAHRAELRAYVAHALGSGDPAYMRHVAREVSDLGAIGSSLELSHEADVVEAALQIAPKKPEEAPEKPKEPTP